MKFETSERFGPPKRFLSHDRFQIEDPSTPGRYFPSSSHSVSVDERSSVPVFQAELEKKSEELLALEAQYKGLQALVTELLHKNQLLREQVVHLQQQAALKAF